MRCRKSDLVDELDPEKVFRSTAEGLSAWTSLSPAAETGCLSAYAGIRWS